MPAAPAAALLLVLGLRQAAPARARRIVGATVVGGLLLGVLILRADGALAGMGRRAAGELIAPRVARGERVWFAGHWGFQWYAERAGGRPLTTSPPRPARGDLVVAASVTPTDRVLEVVPGRQLVETLVDARPGGRVMSRASGAGFYSNGWGFLPWSWGTGDVERFEVWRVQ